MTKSTLGSLLGLTSSLLWAAGCANTRPETASTYNNLPSESLTPTSDNKAQRVYTDDKTKAPRLAPPPGASDENWAITQSIHEALLADRTLAPYPGEATAILDKDSKGLVRLKGTIINDQERKRLRDTIAQIPGVKQVDDQMVVAAPSPQGDVDLQKPVLTK
jgi:hypothetical protein